MKVGNPGKSRGSIAPNGAISETDAAKAMGVSRQSVTRAKKVMKEDPEAHGRVWVPANQMAGRP